MISLARYVDVAKLFMVFCLVLAFKVDFETKIFDEDYVSKRSIGTYMKAHYEPGAFYVLYDNLDFSQNIHGLTDFKNASRFPSLWC